MHFRISVSKNCPYHHYKLYTNLTDLLLSAFLKKDMHIEIEKKKRKGKTTNSAQKFG